MKVIAQTITRSIFLTLFLLACGCGGNRGSEASEPSGQGSSTEAAGKREPGSTKTPSSAKRTLTDDEIVAEIIRLNPFRAELKGAEAPVYSDAALEAIRETHGSEDYREQQPFALKKAVDEWLKWHDSMRRSGVEASSLQWPEQVLDQLKGIGGGDAPPGDADSFEAVVDRLFWALRKEIADLEDQILEKVYRESLASIRAGNYYGDKDLIYVRDKYGAEEPRILLIRNAYNAVVNAGAEKQRDQSRPWVESFLKMPLKEVREQVENRQGMTAYRIKVPEGLIHLGSDLDTDYYIRQNSEADSGAAPSVSVKAQIYLDQTLEDARNHAQDNGASILDGQNVGKGFLLFTEFPGQGVVEAVLSQRTGNRRVEVRADWKQVPDDLRPKAQAYLAKILKSFKFEN